MHGAQRSLSAEGLSGGQILKVEPGVDEARMRKRESKTTPSFLLKKTTKAELPSTELRKKIGGKFCGMGKTRGGSLCMLGARCVMHTEESRWGDSAHMNWEF